MIVRDAELNDVDAVLALMHRFAGDEGLLAYVEVTHDSLIESCLREPKRFHLLVAAADDAVVGYATYLFQFSPWLAREYLFIDDLYVAAAKRGMGIGLLLMQRVAAIALERGVDARWHVEVANRSAQKFYNALGAELRDRFVAYWSREAMRALRQR
jgi:GNAT superfamily N-acetyltransferase